MIKQLVLKDMMMQRKVGVVGFICLLFLAIVDFGSDTVLLKLSILIPILGTIWSTSYEARSKSEKILNSLPFNRKDIVVAKYIFVSILVLLGVIFSFLIGLIQLQNEHITGFMLWGAILGGITGGLVYSMIVLPIEFSVEYSSSKQAAYFMGVIVGGLSGVIVSSEWLDVENAWSTSLVVNVCFIVGLLLLYIISMLLSIHLYSERDL